MEYDYIEIGKVLKKRREELQRKLPDIAEEIKISENYLEAIEDGRADQMPSMVFYNLFVRSYAKELELDAEQLLEDTAKPEVDPAALAENGDAESGEGKSTSKTIFFSLLAVIVVVVAIYIIFFMGKGDNDQAMLPGQGIDSLSGMAGGPYADSLLESDTTEPEIILPDPLNLRIIATDLCWVLVVADDDTLLNNNLEPNAIRNYQAYYNFSISLGNPTGVQMALNGVLLRSISPTGGPVRDVLINRDNMKEYYLFPEEDDSESDQADSSSI